VLHYLGSGCRWGWCWRDHSQRCGPGPADLAGVGAITPAGRGARDFSLLLVIQSQPSS
jgi:hypothetical protein